MLVLNNIVRRILAFGQIELISLRLIDQCKNLLVDLANLLPLTSVTTPKLKKDVVKLVIHQAKVLHLQAEHDDGQSDHH